MSHGWHSFLEIRMSRGGQSPRRRPCVAVSPVVLQGVHFSFVSTASRLDFSLTLARDYDHIPQEVHASLQKLNHPVLLWPISSARRWFGASRFAIAVT
jgi:hypothetical protein